MHDVRTRASFVAELERRGRKVPRRIDYLQRAMGEDYLDQWFMASQEWAEVLLLEARDGYNPLIPDQVEELNRAVEANGLPDEPDWFTKYDWEIEARERLLREGADPNYTGGRW